LLTAAAMRSSVALLVFALAACGAPPTPGPDGGLVLDGGATFTDGGLDLNDVSWLLPLPAASQLDALLSLDANGGRGPLLPRALYDTLPGLVAGEDPSAMYAKLRVVSIRIDPCFPATATGGCIKQLRLVAQPLFISQLTTSTDDGTVHLFFDLSDADFADATRTVWQLRALANGATTGQPLDVHPVMRAQGLRGTYATTLHAMVKRLCGAQNLSRLAFMRLVQHDVAWRFGAFNVVGGALVEDPIPRLNALTQQGVQEFGNTEFRSGELQPAPSGDQLSVLLSESELRLTDQRTFERAVTAALRIEHPARSNPKTADCGSCHTASRALSNARKERPVDLSAHEDRYVANPRFDLRRVDAIGDDPRGMRAFGYFENLSAFSQRTINESAEVAEAMSLTDIHP
jgi:hypothetical protein